MWSRLKCYGLFFLIEATKYFSVLALIITNFCQEHQLNFLKFYSVSLSVPEYEDLLFHDF